MNTTTERLLCAALVLFVVLQLASYCGVVHCDPRESIAFREAPEVYQAKIEKFLTKYFEPCSPKKLKRALDILPDVMQVSQENNIDPLIVATIITHESTWDKNAIGKRGEVGLMQVMGGHKTQIAAFQLHEGVAHFLHSFEVCKTLEGALAYYTTGKTCKPYRGTAIRINTYRRMQNAE